MTWNVPAAAGAGALETDGYPPGTPAAAGCPEGYYLDLGTGDILRIVAPVEEARGCCPREGNEGTEAGSPRYVLVSEDVTLPIPAVGRIARERYGREPSGRVVNRQTAVQPDGALATEEAEMVG